jgi:excisionase family DNA binding protein
MNEALKPLAISAPEAARLLGVSKPTIYTLINRSDFPSFRIGNRVLISVEGLKKWIEKQTEPSEAS